MGCKYGKMTRFEAAAVEFYQDSWTVLYSFIAKELYDHEGFEGEQALREGVRRFGRDRGLSNRQRLLDNNIKINALTLFEEGMDRPGEPRYRISKFRNTEQERFTETDICTYADIFKYYNVKHLGRIYCEEFHQASYGAFGFDKLRVNLTRTKTQDGEDRCFFYDTYRPEYLTEEQRRLSFAEYDPGYEAPVYPKTPPEGRAGYNTLWLKMYYFLLEAAVEYLGKEKGTNNVATGLRNAAAEHAWIFRDMAEKRECEPNFEFVRKHLPIEMDIDAEPFWSSYNKNDAKQLLKTCFYDVLWKELRL